jgi:hypothetical protein
VGAIQYKTQEQLEQQVLALVEERHQQRIKIHWQFSIESARNKLQRHYQAIRTDDATQQCEKT